MAVNADILCVKRRQRRSSSGSTPLTQLFFVLNAINAAVFPVQRLNLAILPVQRR